MSLSPIEVRFSVEITTTPCHCAGLPPWTAHLISLLLIAPGLPVELTVRQLARRAGLCMTQAERLMCRASLLSQ